MTDSLKLAEMQRTNIEFERQRHLANWLIKSSPHMATPQSSSSTHSSPMTVTTAVSATTATALSSTATTAVNGAVTTSASGKYFQLKE